MRIFNIATVLLLALCLTAPVQAHEAGDVLLRFGPTTVHPDTGSDPLAGGEVDLSDDTQLGVGVTWMMNRYLGFEFQASTPFEHNLYIEDESGRDNIGETSQILPSLTAQLHLPQAGKFRPYLGVGVHHTRFSSESLRDQNNRGIPPDYSLKLDAVTDVVGQLGVDVELEGQWFLNAAVWRMATETTATLEDGNGVEQAEVDIEINPTVWTLGVGRKF